MPAGSFQSDLLHLVPLIPLKQLRGQRASVTLKQLPPMKTSGSPQPRPVWQNQAGVRTSGIWYSCSTHTEHSKATLAHKLCLFAGNVTQQGFVSLTDTKDFIFHHILTAQNKLASTQRRNPKHYLLCHIHKFSTSLCFCHDPESARIRMKPKHLAGRSYTFLELEGTE